MAVPTRDESIAGRSNGATANRSLQDSVWDDMLREVLEVGSAISLLRSASENYQDYIPSKQILRLA